MRNIHRKEVENPYSGKVMAMWTLFLESSKTDPLGTSSDIVIGESGAGCVLCGRSICTCVRACWLVTLWLMTRWSFLGKMANLRLLMQTFWMLCDQICWRLAMMQPSMQRTVFVLAAHAPQPSAGWRPTVCQTI